MSGSEGDVVPGLFGPRLVRALRRWSASYAGGCEHRGPQFARVGAVRSGCYGCTDVFDGWDRSAPCDGCGRVTEADRGWTVPADQTQGVQVFLRACDYCSPGDLPREPTIEEDLMDATASTTCCGDCRERFTRAAAAGAARSADYGRLHPECRTALSEALAGFAQRRPQAPIGTRMRVHAALARMRRAS